MDHERRELLASLAIVAIFLTVQFGALALVEPFQEGGFQEVENTEDPSLSIAYVGAILVATLFMLAALRYGGDEILRLIIIGAGVYITLFVLEAVVPAVLTISLGGLDVNLLAAGGAIGLGAALLGYPEWYVIDVAGIVMGIGAAALFGINFGILPSLVLLSVLAVYDAISVYGTEHMLTLASGVMDMRVPVLFVVPLSLSYSFLDETKPDAVREDGESSGGESDTGEPTEETLRQGADETLQPDADETLRQGADETPEENDESGEEEVGAESPSELDAAALNDLGPEGVRALDDEWLAEVELGEEEREALDEPVLEVLEERAGDRDALFIGLGDAVIPTVLVASAAFFVDAGPTLSLAGVSATLPAVTAIVGTTAGLVVLLWMVRQGRAHAGLPLLNGGTIAGYLLGALASGLSLVEALGIGSYL